MEHIYLFNAGTAAIIEDTDEGTRELLIMLTADDAPLGDDTTTDDTNEE